MSETPIKMIQFKAVDGRTVVKCKPCELDDGVTQVCTLPIFSLNLCDSEFKNPPQRFINFIVSYLQSLVGKDVYVVHYLPLRKGMEDIDVYQGTVKKPLYNHSLRFWSYRDNQCPYWGMEFGYELFSNRYLRDKTRS